MRRLLMGRTGDNGDEQGDYTLDPKSLPDHIVSTLETHDITEPVRVAAVSDIVEGSRYGRAYLLASEKELLVLAGENGTIHLRARHDFDALETIETVGFVGSGAVEIVHGGDRQRILAYSAARTADFTRAVEQIRGLIDRHDQHGETTPQREMRRCPNCHLELPDNSARCPRCSKKARILLRLMAFTLPYKKLVALVFTLMTLGALFGLATPWMSKLFIDYILRPDPVTGTFTHAHWLPFAALALLLAHAGQLFFTSLHERIAGALGYRTTFDVRGKVYERLQELSLSYFDKHQTGAIMARVNQDTGELQRFLVDFIPLTLESLFLLTGVGVFLFILSWKLTLIVLVPVGATVLFLKKVFPSVRAYFHRYFHRRSRMSALVNDALTGVRVIKAFGQEKLEARKFDGRSAQYRDAGIALIRKWSVYRPLLHFFVMIGSVVVWFVGGLQVIAGAMTLGSVVAYAGYLAMFYRPVFTLTRMVEMISTSLSAADRVFEVLDAEPEIADAPDAVAMPRIEGAVGFDSVTFGYDRFKPVIREMSLEIEPNEVIGLVGRSGAGKSTMINLLTRLYDTNRGCVSIDGIDVRRIRYADIRAQIGVVLQETFLFNGTIFDNIAYARPEASVEEVIDAAIAANAHEFIMQKADGYDTEVGERGNRLSGGEKQRIAIARAILRDPRILILDEATSSVDTETEKKIQTALERLMKGRTTIAIAHRLSTLRNCDRLFVIDDGRVAETGTHEELMKRQGVFYKLVTMQREMSQIIAVDG